MRQRGVLAYIMISLMTIMGVVNFFAQFLTNYHTDPLITYIFMGMASAIAGFKGLGAAYFQRPGQKVLKPPAEEKE